MLNNNNNVQLNKRCVLFLYSLIRTHVFATTGGSFFFFLYQFTRTLVFGFLFFQRTRLPDNAYIGTHMLVPSLYAASLRLILYTLPRY